MFGVQPKQVADPFQRPVEDHVEQIRRVQPTGSREAGYRLNLVIPTVNANATFGGVQTALDVFEAIGAADARRRIITLDVVDGTATDLLRTYPLKTAIEDSSDSLQVVSVAESAGATLPIGPKDVFVSTFWTTADLARRFRRWQAQEYGAAPALFGYVIQDFEPGFYPWSAQYLLALATYHLTDETVAVFNTGLLRDYFHRAGITFKHEFAFEPNLPAQLRSHSPSPSHPRQRRIVVYGRPRSRRNAFPLIVDGLRAWQASYGGSTQWTVVSAGQPHPDVDLGSGLSLRSLGKLTLDDYSTLLAESAIGISFMVSPHPSYPPLEMANLGMLVLTNRFADKDLSTWHTNITSLREVSAEGIADDLADLCRRFDADPGVGGRGSSRGPDPLAVGSPLSFGVEVADLLRAGAAEERPMVGETPISR